MVDSLGDTLGNSMGDWLGDWLGTTLGDWLSNTVDEELGDWLSYWVDDTMVSLLGDEEGAVFMLGVELGKNCSLFLPWHNGPVSEHKISLHMVDAMLEVLFVHVLRHWLNSFVQ